MAKRKYYAVKVGKTPGIYGTWNECQEQVKGFPGAVYKSFDTMEEAEAFISGTESETAFDQEVKTTSTEDFNSMVDDRIASLKEDEVVAFVDGSYDSSEEKSAFGVLLFSAGGRKDTLYKAFTKNLGEEFIALRNVAAELEGVKEAISWAVTYKKKRICVFYDYEGIEKWATGEWRAKKDITRKYVAFMQEKKRCIEVEFKKVLAHSGVRLNEEVDMLAKNALLAKGYKTYKDGSVYFTGYGLDDWKAIFSVINEENKSLSAGEIADINFTIDEIGSRKKITVFQNSSKVVVNCYENSKSYVQGRQTVLFQKIIAIAVELLQNGQSVIEILNNYHALTITKTEVENRFDELLPHYRMETEKQYSNLLSSVYNTMLTGYMPDYTCLVMPAFRAYEFYLHKILGDIMELETERENGTNNFSFFAKDSFGKYECKSKNVDKLSEEQLEFLNKLYTQYNGVRHPYSHWSASDMGVAVIPDCETARELIFDSLKLIDQFYIIF